MYRCGHTDRCWASHVSGHAFSLDDCPVCNPSQAMLLLSFSLPTETAPLEAGRSHGRPVERTTKARSPQWWEFFNVALQALANPSQYGD